jgi:hypothetical protein
MFVHVRCCKRVDVHASVVLCANKKWEAEEEKYIW